MASTSIVPADVIRSQIHVLRGHKVMLDSELADLYQVKLKALNQAVNRNVERFPDDFMFQLTADEYAALRSQSVTKERGRRSHAAYAPYAFTEQGVGMLSSVLRSPRAVQVNIAIVRAFVELRRYSLTHAELRERIDALELKTNRGFKKVLDLIRAMMEPDAHRPTLGFARKKVG